MITKPPGSHDDDDPLGGWLDDSIELSREKPVSPVPIERMPAELPPSPTAVAGAVPLGEGDLTQTQIAQKIALVTEFFQQLSKAFKGIGLYRHNRAMYADFLKPAYQVIADVLEKYENVTLHVEQLAFRALGARVYEDEASEQNLAYKFYRDGIRLLILRQGLTPEELLDFVLICLTNFKDEAFANEDTGTLLWKRSFVHIEYVIMESYALGLSDGATDDTLIEIDKIVDHMVRGLTSQTRDSHQYARLSLDDLDVELDGVEQVSGLVIEGSAATPQDQMNIQFQLEQQDAQQMMPRLAEILFEMFEEELDMGLAEKVEVAFTVLLDSFLLQENLEAIDDMLERLGELQSRPLPPGSLALIQHLTRSLIVKMGETERLERVGQILETSPGQEKVQAVELYLVRLDVHAVGSLITVLEGLNHPLSRRTFCDALIGFGPDQLQFYENRLTSPKPNVIRDMLYIINRIEVEDRSSILAKLLGHPNMAIRVEALKALADSGEEAAGAYITMSLRDRDAQVRATAALLLPALDVEEATQTLMEIVQRSDFSEKSIREQVAMYSALAATNAPGALDYFRQQLNQTSLLGKKQLVEHKRNMLNGIAATGSIAVYRLLNEFRSTLKEKDLLPVVERALARLKERLLGGQSGGGGDA